MWFVRFLIARSGIIIAGVLVGFAARYLFGPPATDQIDLAKPDLEASQQFGEKLDRYQKLIQKTDEADREAHRKEMEAIGNILINSGD